MKRILKLFTSVTLLAIIAITIFLYTQSHPLQGPGSAGSGTAQDDEIRFRASIEPITRSVEIQGKSSYVNEAIIYAPFGAEVKVWRVDEGVEVHAGDPLFELEAGKLEYEIALAEARILQQQLELKLLESEDESSVAVPAGESPLRKIAGKEEAKLRQQLKRIELDIARDALKDSRGRLDKAVFPAPVDGIFLFVGDHRPQLLEQDKPVGKIVDMSELQLVSQVGEFEVFRIREGMEVEVGIDALSGKIIHGRVQRISKFAKTGTDQNAGEAKFEIVIALDKDPELIAGLSLTGKIVTDRKENALVVPTIAVMREEGEYFVYVEEAGGVQKRPVRIGIETADKTQITEGLAEGETVVLR